MGAPNCHYRRGPRKYARNCNGMTHAMCSLSNVLCQSLVQLKSCEHDLIRESAACFRCGGQKAFTKGITQLMFFCQTICGCIYQMCIQFLLLTHVWFIVYNISRYSYMYIYIYIRITIYIYIFVCMYAYIKPHSITLIYLYLCAEMHAEQKAEIYIISTLCSVYVHLATFMRVSSDFSSFSLLVVG